MLVTNGGDPGLGEGAIASSVPFTFTSVAGLSAGTSGGELDDGAGTSVGAEGGESGTGVGLGIIDLNLYEG